MLKKKNPENTMNVEQWGVDLHVHTSFSPDARLPMKRACRAALARNLKIIGFADHAEFLKEDEAYVEKIDQAKIQAEIAELRKVYEGRLEILSGVEIGYVPGMEKQIKDFLSSHPFDYAVGSVHYVNGKLVSSWVRERESEGRGFTDYFQTVLQAARTGLFQILGHLDYVRKYLYSPRDYRCEEYEGITDGILKTARKKGMVVELNTSGWRHATGLAYPERKMLERFKGLGGKVTIGSDAHRYYEVAYGNRKALALLRDLGFTSIQVFRNRKLSSLSI